MAEHGQTKSLHIVYIVHAGVERADEERRSDQ
jgi:hypothetical protein